MNLEELKKAAFAPKKHDWRGQEIWLKPFTAQDHLDLFARIEKEKVVPREYDQDRAATIAFNINIVARAVCDEGGKLTYASDEGRSKLLTDMPFQALVELTDLVLKDNGYKPESAETPEKKT